MSSLEKGLAILGLLSDERQVLRVGEVCRDLDMPKASVSRMMRTLADAGFLEQDSRDASYSVGIRMLDLGRLFLARHNLLDLVTRAIEELAEAYGFTGHAAIVAGRDRVMMASRYGSYPLQHVGGIAGRKQAFESIIGLSILARKKDPEILELFGLTDPDAKNGELDATSLLARIHHARQTRVIQVTDLVTPGVSSIGTSVGDPSSDEVIGFSLSYPTIAASEELAQRMVRDVERRARDIGRQIRDPLWI